VTTFGAMLAFSGYNPYVFTQTREFLAGMRWLIAGFPLIALTLSFMIISFYPLSGRARFKAMKENLKNLHQQKGVN
jgi:Na+/melibiose symporter-like transporter